LNILFGNIIIFNYYDFSFNI
jgi:hypothetical protein